MARKSARQPGCHSKAGAQAGRAGRSPRVLELVEVVREHGLLTVVVHEGVSLPDAVELLETPRKELMPCGIDAMRH